MKIEKNIPYSFQALTMIDNLKEFDKDDFEDWFVKKLSIGSNNILEYLIDKKRNKSNIIIPNMELKNGK